MVEDRPQQKLEGFVAHWGWLYVVFQMSEFYRCSRNDIYELNINEFYNDLAFMKDKYAYDNELAEKQMAENRL